MELVRARDARADGRRALPAAASSSCGRLAAVGHHRRARDGRRPRDARPPARARGQRRPGDAARRRRSGSQPETHRGGLGGVRAATATSAGARWRARQREVLHRRRHRLGHRLARTSPTARATGSTPFWPDPAHYRARRALLRVARLSAAPRTPRATAACARRSTPTAARAPRRASATASSTSRRCSPHDLPRFAAEGVVASMQAAAHGVARARPQRQLVAAARRRRALRPRVPDPLAARVGRRDRARLRLAGRALRPARGAGVHAAAPPAGRARPRARTTTRRSTGWRRCEGYTTRRGVTWPATRIGSGASAPGFLRRPHRVRRGPGRRATPTT